LLALLRNLWSRADSSVLELDTLLRTNVWDRDIMGLGVKQDRIDARIGQWC
jgi:hypothetical protein